MESYSTGKKISLSLCAARPIHHLLRIVAKEFYTELEAQTAIIEILLAVQYCHSFNIVHRGIETNTQLDSSSEIVLIRKLFI